MQLEEKSDKIDNIGGSTDKKERLSQETSDSGSAPSSYCEEVDENSSNMEPTPPVTNSAKLVIVGDAIHNFADGLAIGAAFPIIIAAGFSTSLAVFCHELPNEVGDFTLLIKSGMQIKTAVLFNILSSMFAIFSMVAGFLLGSSVFHLAVVLYSRSLHLCGLGVHDVRDWRRRRDQEHHPEPNRGVWLHIPWFQNSNFSIFNK